MKRDLFAVVGSLALLLAALLGACGAASALIPDAGRYYPLCAGVSLLITGGVAFALYRKANMRQ